MIRDTVEDLFPGCGTDPLCGINENEAARKADEALKVEFYKEAVEDYLPTHGGQIDIIDMPEERRQKLEALGCTFRKVPKEPDVLRVAPCGRRIFKEEDYVRIQRVGDRDLVNERKATEHDKQRFARQWKIYADGQEGVAGTALTELPFINAAMRKELEYFGVMTGEAILAMTDANAAKFPYLSKVKPLVARYLDAKAADAPFKVRDAKVASLESTVAALQAQLAEMQAAKPVEVEDEEPNPKHKR